MASGSVLGRGSSGFTGGHVVRIRLNRERLPSGASVKEEWPPISSRDHSPTPPDSGTSSDLDAYTPSPNFDSLSEADYSSDSGSKISFYNFHLSEIYPNERLQGCDDQEDTFAGQKYVDAVESSSKTIRSSKGTVRGVKNRVRAGIATFLHINTNKTWQEKEAGKIVIYTTTMGIVRETATRCQKVRHILRTHMAKYLEKDCFMSKETQAEIKERIGSQNVTLPLVFVGGQYLGDADAVEKLNESGELRRILKPFKCAEACDVCQTCGGYRVLPCGMCNGSKKSVHRNHFTTELIALKCMNCDEVGLVKCFHC